MNHPGSAAAAAGVRVAAESGICPNSKKTVRPSVVATPLLRVPSVGKGMWRGVVAPVEGATVYMSFSAMMISWLWEERKRRAVALAMVTGTEEGGVVPGEGVRGGGGRGGGGERTGEWDGEEEGGGGGEEKISV